MDDTVQDYVTSHGDEEVSLLGRMVGVDGRNM